ncbi:hypothetical protein [Clostridium tertium]
MELRNDYNGVNFIFDTNMFEYDGIFDRWDTDKLEYILKWNTECYSRIIN